MLSCCNVEFIIDIRRVRMQRWDRAVKCNRWDRHVTSKAPGATWRQDKSIFLLSEPKIEDRQTVIFRHACQRTSVFVRWLLRWRAYVAFASSYMRRLLLRWHLAPHLSVSARYTLTHTHTHILTETVCNVHDWLRVVYWSSDVYQSTWFALRMTNHISCNIGLNMCGPYINDTRPRSLRHNMKCWLSWGGVVWRHAAES